jgi:hypothetical protein
MKNGKVSRVDEVIAEVLSMEDLCSSCVGERFRRSSDISGCGELQRNFFVECSGGLQQC